MTPPDSKLSLPMTPEQLKELVESKTIVDITKDGEVVCRNESGVAVGRTLRVAFERLKAKTRG